jgi:hypothetical protein
VLGASSEAGASPEGHGGQVRLLVVQQLHQVVHHLVADLVLAPQADQLAPLGLDRRVAQAVHQLHPRREVSPSDAASAMRSAISAFSAWAHCAGTPSVASVSSIAVSAAELMAARTRTCSSCRRQREPTLRPADQRRQRQALAHQRRQDHHEGDEDDQVAVRGTASRQAA